MVEDLPNMGEEQLIMTEGLLRIGEE